MNAMNELSERQKLILSMAIHEYVRTAAPVSSLHLVEHYHLDMSSATVRNELSALTEMGYLRQPHTSAGRVPTARGYRLFVDTLITAEPESLTDSVPPPALALPPDQPQKVIANAAHMLSSLSQFVGVVMSPRHSSAFRHIEFLRLSEKRILVIIVSLEGNVQNRVLFTDSDFTPSQLVEAGNYLNTHFSGLALEQVALRLKGEVENLRSEIAALMQAAIAASTEAVQDEQNDVVIAGERNLLEVSDFAQDMSQLRRAFNLFEQKTLLMRLLDETSQAAGIRIYIGGENQSTPLEELSMVSAPYAVNGQVVGTLGVIGPTRMPYQRMIEIVDITSRMIGNALSA